MTAHAPTALHRRITNALTVDVEDYFQVSALASHIDRSDWEKIPCRVERNVDEILELFERHHAKATFFTLGWVAQRYPGVVRRIVQSGHELASHGYGHHRATDLSREQFAQDVIQAKKILEDISGKSVIGYRAPSFSIGADNLWAFDVLIGAGYRYSSSIYPIHHDHYGMPDAPRFSHSRAPGLMEFPVTTLRLFRTNLPAGGGGYFRFFPYAVSKWLLRRVNAVDQQPCIFYFHPWEIDHEQPLVPGIGFKTRFRHYVNLRKTQHRLGRLLRDFSWGPMASVFRAQLT